jgi:hypothetical protein
MQRVVILLILLSFTLAAGGAVGIADDEVSEICIKLEKIMLKPPEGVEQTRASVEFTHIKHLIDFPCSSCHHTWEGEGDVLSCTAQDCHDLATKPPWGTRKASPRYLDYTEAALGYFEFAYHKQCLECHREYREQGNEDAYMACWKCHPQEWLVGP